MAGDAITDEDRQTRVFISYSRKDDAFADKLLAALSARGFEAYLDKHDILPGEPWQERLGGLIASADTLVFCVSPNSVASEICDWEVNEAKRLAKRLLPVVATDTPDEKVPGRLKRLNYIFMRGQAEFADGIEKLVATLNTDIVWIREHTRLGERTKEWNTNKKAEAGLLRDDDIAKAETWITQRPREASEINQEIATFIATSRQAASAREKRARRRNRMVTSASLSAALIMGVL